MRYLIFSCLILFTIPSFTQKTKKIKELMQEDFSSYDNLQFKHIFQKVSLKNGILHTTVLNQDKDIQMYVRYKYVRSAWRIRKVGVAGTFYAGNNVVGRIVPGATANIYSVPDLANERDYVQLPDNSVWFTSDKSGLFKVYKLDNKKVKEVAFNNTKNKHIINLWNFEQSLFFDVFDTETHTAKPYCYCNEKLSLLPYNFNSISFNDSVLVYIKKAKLFIHHKHTIHNLLKFAFAFTDTTYSKGITFSQQEIETFHIDSEFAIDGVLTDNAKEQIRETLGNNPQEIQENRANRILEKIGDANKLISFAFAFTDTTYRKGITFNQQEVEVFGIGSTSVIDGVLTDSAKEKISEILTNSNHALTKSRTTKILGKLEKANKIVSFSFAFLNESYTDALQLTTKEQQQLGITNNVDNNGVINTEGKARIAKLLKSDSLQLGDKKRDYIKQKVNANLKPTVKFYGFFADTFTYVTAQKPVTKINHNGMVTVEGLEEYLKKQKKNEHYTKLLSILATRAWIENKQLSLSDTVTIQLGLYSTKLNNFTEHVILARKINEKQATFLRSINIYSFASHGYYIYRTKTSVKDIIRLKEALYFDSPFIIGSTEKTMYPEIK